MPTLDDGGWHLLDAVTQHALSPETFEIPDESIRSRLVPGCDAKLMFSLRTRMGEKVERMWVRVTGYTDTGYVGELRSRPQTLKAAIAPGDLIEFGPDHVIDALPPENWNADTGEYE